MEEPAPRTTEGIVHPMMEERQSEADAIPDRARAFDFIRAVQKALIEGDPSCEEELVWSLLAYGMLREAAERIDFLAAAHGRRMDEALERFDYETVSMLEREHDTPLWRVLYALGISVLYRTPRRGYVASSKAAEVLVILQWHRDAFAQVNHTRPPRAIDLSASAELCVGALRENGREAVDDLPYLCSFLEGGGERLPPDLCEMVAHTTLPTPPHPILPTPPSYVDFAPAHTPVYRRAWRVRDILAAVLYPPCEDVLGKREQEEQHPEEEEEEEEERPDGTHVNFDIPIELLEGSTWEGLGNAVDWYTAHAAVEVGDFGPEVQPESGRISRMGHSSEVSTACAMDE